MRISNWSSDVCSSDLRVAVVVDDQDPPAGVFVARHRQVWPRLRRITDRQMNDEFAAGTDLAAAVSVDRTAAQRHELSNQAQAESETAVGPGDILLALYKEFKNLGQQRCGNAVAIVLHAQLRRAAQPAQAEDDGAAQIGRAHV